MSTTPQVTSLRLSNLHHSNFSVGSVNSGTSASPLPCKSSLDFLRSTYIEIQKNRKRIKDNRMPLECNVKILGVIAGEQPLYRGTHFVNLSNDGLLRLMQGKSCIYSGYINLDASINGGAIIPSTVSTPKTKPLSVNVIALKMFKTPSHQPELILEASSVELLFETRMQAKEFSDTLKSVIKYQNDDESDSGNSSRGGSPSLKPPAIPIKKENEDSSEEELKAPAAVGKKLGEEDELGSFEESDSEDDANKKKGVEGLIQIENPNRIIRMLNKVKELGKDEAGTEDGQAGPTASGDQGVAGAAGGSSKVSFDKSSAKPELSRREREELDRQSAEAHYAEGQVG